jgi:replicative DNA helicase
MDPSLASLDTVLAQADFRVRAGSRADACTWPTGFDALDEHLSGGLRSGELVLLGGPQGLGKSTWALQVARNLVSSGRTALFFSFEHDLASLLVRLVALEAGLIAGPEAPSTRRVRQSFEAADGLGGSLADRLSGTEGGVAALERVHEYAERLVLHRSSGASTDLEVIRQAIDTVGTDTGQSPLVIVDYLQKVHVPGRPDEGARVTTVVEGLKDLALDHDVPVLATVAADKAGIESGRRMRVSHLRGSSSLAYEADTVLLLNNKFDVVARHHLVYDVSSADRFRGWAVLSLEKSRNGRSGIDLEFATRFDQSRFDTAGRPVVEQLVDDRIFLE